MKDKDIVLIAAAAVGFLWLSNMQRARAQGTAPRATTNQMPQFWAVQGLTTLANNLFDAFKSPKVVYTSSAADGGQGPLSPTFQIWENSTEGPVGSPDPGYAGVAADAWDNPRARH